MRVSRTVERGSCERKGRIFDIDRYAIHDGPGIRWLIFMKGCPLECLWCSNPEGQDFEPEVAYFPAKCLGCGACVEACSRNAVKMVDGKPVTDWDLCDQCAECAEACFPGARKLFGTTVTSSELLARVKSDVVFFQNSGGGITIGGGEVTAQPEFVADFLKKCKRENLHTAIETCGYCSWQKLKEIARYTDLVFFDIKHMDSQKHRTHTGVSNRKILENLIKLSREEVDLIVRIPVVPGFNDDETNIKATAELIKEKLSLDRFKRLELLPYHRLGTFKYERLGKEYVLGALTAPSDAQMECLKGVVESYDLPCAVGG